jgi:hypothetical protein
VADPAYKSMDLDPATMFRLQALTALDAPVPTLDDLKASIDRNGADPAILEVGLLLGEDQYRVLKTYFDREKRMHPWPKRSKIRRHR